MKICILSRSNKGNDVEDLTDIRDLKKAGEKRGHKVTIIDPINLVFEISGKYRIRTVDNIDLLNFDRYILRICSIKNPLTNQVQSSKGLIAKYLLDNNKIILDAVEAFRISTKSKIYDFYELAIQNIPLVPTLYIENNLSENLEQTIIQNEFNYPSYILKPDNGLQGKNIFKAENMEQALGIIKKHKNIHFLLQPLLNIKHDLRVIVLGGKVLGAMDKIHAKGDFRGNISAGAKGIAFPITSEIESIALNAAKADGGEFAGIDIAITDNNEKYILEVNRSLGFEGFTKYTNINVADKIINYLENK